MSRPAWLGAFVVVAGTPLLAVPPGSPAVAAAEGRMPAVRVVVADDVTEGDTVRIAVLLDQPSGHRVSVRVDTRAGTALAPADYRAVHRRVTVPAGRTVVRVALRTAADGTDEGPEELDVRLGRPRGAELARSTATVTIRDRDPLPRVGVLEATFTEPVLGHRLGFTEVRLSEPSGRRVVVGLETRSGTAKADRDFVRLHPLVVFVPGATSQLVSVELLADDIDEPAETLRLVITSARHAVATGRGTITVLDAPGGRTAR
jgi:large repetitive protein